jgi:UDPglucose 6-dehydrogenase
MEEAKKLLPQKVQYFDDVYEMIKGVDACVLLTEWNEYRGLDPARIRELMAGNVFVDLRNVYERSVMQESGFVYSCVGRSV